MSPGEEISESNYQALSAIVTGGHRYHNQPYPVLGIAIVLVLRAFLAYRLYVIIIGPKRAIIAKCTSQIRLLPGRRLLSFPKERRQV